MRIIHNYLDTSKYELQNLGPDFRSFRYIQSVSVSLSHVHYFPPT